MVSGYIENDGSSWTNIRLDELEDLISENKTLKQKLEKIPELEVKIAELQNEKGQLKEEILEYQNINKTVRERLVKDKVNIIKEKEDLKQKLEKIKKIFDKGSDYECQWIENEVFKILDSQEKE